jgi:probable HAF family extracellular repeat protein
MTDLGTFGGPGSWAYDINEHGQVIGGFFDAAEENHVFLWENGVMTQVDTTGRFQYSGAVDINDLGQVVGNTTKAHGPIESFVWQSCAITVLVHGYIHDINNEGTAAAGYLAREKDRAKVAAVWLAK